jgi:hypothetical protein
MTQDEIIEMATQAELNLYVHDLTEKRYIEVIEAFANLVAAKEREACAKLVDDWSDWHGGTELIAAVIRERGQA